MNKVREIMDNISKIIVGKDDTVLLLITALLAGGHVLLEDVPGTGKTLLARSIAKSVSASFNRIQFTPDLLPSDITGLNVYQPSTGDFVFKPGPVFSNIILADEINRATPRTQAGLLECMEERQVTIDGITRKLEEPFFVIATQNPVETSGTFPLPEAQLDRFVMKLSMGLPDKAEEIRILERFQTGDRKAVLEELNPVVSPKDIEEMKNEASKVKVHPQIMEYIADIVQGTRKRQNVTSGVSPRGTLALMHCAKAFAYTQGRDYVVPEDVKKLTVPVLSHRLIMNGDYGISSYSEDVMESILEETTVPTEKEFM